MFLKDIELELDTIERSITKLRSDIKDMQKSDTVSEREEKLVCITNEAKRYPIAIKALVTLSEDAKILVISSLAYLILLEQEDIYSRLHYLCRLAKGCGLTVTAEEIYLLGLQFKKEKLERLCTDFINFKYIYLTEALIIANITGKVSVTINKAIANLALLFLCDKDELRIVAKVAKCRLTENFDLLLDLPCLNKIYCYRALSEYIPESWLISQRQHCGSFYVPSEKKTFFSAFGSRLDTTYSSRGIVCLKQLKHNKEVVKKADYLVEFKKISESNTSIMSSPKDGILFTFELYVNTALYRLFFVVSCFDNYNLFCSWIRSYNDMEIWIK